MAEYIERKAAIKAVEKNDCEGHATWAIKSVPIADVVEVVRCEECKMANPCSDDRDMYCIGLSLLQAADAIEELIIKLNHADDQIDRLVKAAEERSWIPVDERLPDIHVEVLVCTEDYGKTGLGFATVAKFDGTEWLECWERKTYLTAVTHWMPLPQPPKGEEDVDTD